MDGFQNDDPLDEVIDEVITSELREIVIDVWREMMEVDREKQVKKVTPCNLWAEMVLQYFLYPQPKVLGKLVFSGRDYSGHDHEKVVKSINFDPMLA